MFSHADGQHLVLAYACAFNLLIAVHWMCKIFCANREASFIGKMYSVSPKMSQVSYCMCVSRVRWKI